MVGWGQSWERTATATTATTALCLRRQPVAWRPRRPGSNYSSARASPQARRQGQCDLVSPGPRSQGRRLQKLKPDPKKMFLRSGNSTNSVDPARAASGGRSVPPPHGLGPPLHREHLSGCFVSGRLPVEKDSPALQYLHTAGARPGRQRYSLEQSTAKARCGLAWLSFGLG